MSKGSIGYKRISVVMSYLLAVPFGLVMMIMFADSFYPGGFNTKNVTTSSIFFFVGTPLVFFLPRWVYMTLTWIGAGFKEDKA